MGLCRGEVEVRALCTTNTSSIYFNRMRHKNKNERIMIIRTRFHLKKYLTGGGGV